MTAWHLRTSRFVDPMGALRLGHFVDVLQRFPAGHLLDLGAGHGLFSRLAADLGWRVTAVDARDERFPRDDRVRWVRADVRDFDEYEGVDLVACLGLWYHLTLDDQVALARRMAPRPVILDTHFAMPRRKDHHHHADRVSDLVQQDGYEGRLYSETGLHTRPTASWGNELSFWPTVPTLERQFYDAGYDVLEHLSPPPCADRHYVVVRSWSPEHQAWMDGLISTYRKMSDPGAAPCDPAAASLAAASLGANGGSGRGLVAAVARLGRGRRGGLGRQRSPQGTNPPGSGVSSARGAGSTAEKVSSPAERIGAGLGTGDSGRGTVEQDGVLQGTARQDVIDLIAGAREPRTAERGESGR